MKTRLLLTLCVCALIVGNAFSAEVTTRTSAPENNVTLQEKILEELEVIRFHAEKNDRLREEARKKYEQKNPQSSGVDSAIVSAEYEMLSEIENHTKEDIIKDGWNLYGWVAIALSVISLLVSIRTYFAQKNVEKQTKNASLEVQCGVLDDLYRHLYRNLLCTCAILYKFKGINGVRSATEYPSEANLKKLTTLPEDVILPIDIKDDEVYGKMHEIKKLLKNYNMEIDVASKHFSCKEIENKCFKNDYDNLLFKPLYLISQVFGLWDIFKKHKRSQVVHKHEYAIGRFVLEHFNKLNFNNIGNPETLAYLKKTEVNFNERASFASLFDCLMSVDGIDKNSIQRSLEEFCKNLDVDGFIGKDMKIKKRDLENYLYGQKFGDGKWSESIESVLQKRRNDVSGKEKQAQLDSGGLHPYFDLFSKDEWMLDELLFHILRVDIALEIPKIGMINYN